jgi:hypothetical protein
MSLFSRVFGKEMKDPIRGQAQVVAASIPPRGVSGSSNCDLDLVVTVEGLEPYAHSMTSWLTPTSKWPYSGQVLPVSIDRADPEHVKIEWDDVPSTDDVTFAEAERLAESMRTGGSATPEGIPTEAAAIVEQLTEMFPDATVTVNEPVEVSLDQLRGDDRISQLERLAKLHAQGALTDSEFQAEKARILGES